MKIDLSENLRKELYAMEEIDYDDIKRLMTTAIQEDRAKASAELRRLAAVNAASAHDAFLHNQDDVCSYLESRQNAFESAADLLDEV